MNIQKERIKRKRTQKELAEDLDVSLQTVKFWERKNNPVMPGLVNQRKLSKWVRDNPVETF